MRAFLCPGMDGMSQRARDGGVAMFVNYLLPRRMQSAQRKAMFCFFSICDFRVLRGKNACLFLAVCT